MHLQLWGGHLRSQFFNQKLRLKRLNTSYKLCNSWWKMRGHFEKLCAVSMSNCFQSLFCQFDFRILQAKAFLSPKGNWKELNNEFDSVFTGCTLGACSQPQNLGNGWGVVCNSHSWLVFLEVMLFSVFSVRKGWGHLYPVQLFQVRLTERSCSGVAAKSILAFFGQFNDPSEGNNETLKAFWYFTKLFYVKKPAELNWVVKQSIIRRQIG